MFKVKALKWKTSKYYVYANSIFGFFHIDVSTFEWTCQFDDTVNMNDAPNPKSLEAAKKRVNAFYFRMLKPALERQ